MSRISPRSLVARSMPSEFARKPARKCPRQVACTLLAGRPRLTAAIAVLAFGMSLFAGSVQAERPMAPELLPEKTLALIRVPDSREFVEKFRESAMGRMLQDEQVKPLATQLYGSLADAFGRVQDQVGLPLDKLLAIPQGELCLALVAMPDSPPALVALIEVGDQLPSAQRLLDRGSEELERNGAVKSTQAIGDVLLNTWKINADRERTIALAIKDGVIVLSTNVDAAKNVLAAWRGERKEGEVSLAENRKFTAIMNRCGGAKGERPQFTWFIDPIDLARAGARGNFAAQTGLALLPALGLDGLQGLGGSLILVAGEFDAIQHVHVLLDSPRNGVLRAIALEAGDTTPEPWVPGDVASYATWRWNVEVTYGELSRLVDSFQSEGAVSRWVKQRLSEPLGVDFEQDLLAAADGRMTYLTWFERPVRLNSQTQLIAIKLKDSAEFKKTLEKMVDKYSDRFEKASFGGVNFHKIKVPEGGDRPRGRFGVQRGENGNETRVQMNLRAPDPCFGILGDYLVAADSVALLQHCIVTQSDAEKSLANELDFKLIAGKIARQVGGESPALVTFNRPEEGIRMLYDLAMSDNTRGALASRAADNPFFKSVDQALKDNPLPPFAVIARYLAPGGGMLTNDETGFHFTTFGVRRK